MLTTAEAAVRLGVQRQWVTRLIKAGRLKATWNNQFKRWQIDETDANWEKIADPPQPHGRPRKGQ